MVPSWICNQWDQVGSVMTQELVEWQYCTLSGTTARVVWQFLDMLFCATVPSQIRPIQVRELE